MTALPGCLVGQFELGLGPEIERARALVICRPGAP